MLRHFGAQVVEAGTAEEALEAVRVTPITAAVTELLFLAGGQPLQQALRLGEQTAHVRHFIVTADIRLDRHEEAPAAGCIAIHLKPYEPRRLAALIFGDPR